MGTILPIDPNPAFPSTHDINCGFQGCEMQDSFDLPFAYAKSPKVAGSLLFLE